MGIQRLQGDDDGVSAVIGIVILVAVTVVLAGAAASFLLGQGERPNEAPPEIDFAYEYSQAGLGQLTVVHEGGDTVDPGRLTLVTSAAKFHPGPGNMSGSPTGSAIEDYGLESAADGGDWVPDALAPGSEFTVVGASAESLERVIVQIVWADPSTNQTAVLSEWRGPDA